MTDSDPSDYVVTVVKPGDECPQCGESEYGSRDAITKAVNGNLMCRRCASTFHSDGEYVPVEALEDLVQEWHQTAQADAYSEYESGVNSGIEWSADELEALITDYTNE